MVLNDFIHIHSTKAKKKTYKEKKTEMEIQI